MYTPSQHDSSANLSAPLAARIATAPISWGVCEVPGWGHQLPVDRVLAEMRSLGFTHTELGSAGWLPEEVEPLRAVLDRHGLAMLASFVPLVMHRPEEAEGVRLRAKAAADLLASIGARYFNTAPVTTYDWEPRRALTDDEWQHLYRMMAEVEEICAEHGLHQVVHEHIGCVIETKDEVERMLDNTETDLVLDTGHLAIGGFDPMEVVKRYRDRIGLVHLKDVDLDVARRFREESMSLMEAVQAGLFPAIGRGDLPMAEVVDHLEATDYRGWYVVEQDCAITGDMPADGEGPVLDVAASLSFINRNINAFAGQEA
ncbi:MAG: sugar phosphate isomerase/epimerase [Actinomycetota bacterium]